MSHKAKVYRVRRGSRPILIGNSEIRPLSQATSPAKAEQPVNGTFTPGGSYQLEKFPALKSLIQKSWDTE